MISKSALSQTSNQLVSRYFGETRRDVNEHEAQQNNASARGMSGKGHQETILAAPGDRLSSARSGHHNSARSNESRYKKSCVYTYKSQQ